jgi:RND family efflux transporter MFP subunit
LVVYGGSDERFYYGGDERIREGATVRERQSIITIPDMSHMSVKVAIHESYIKKVKRGQKARITVDAFADKELHGEVSKVGVLPDSQNRWMNPDLKVYITTISVDGTHDWLKPGMTAKVEIQVGHLDNVVHVPVQAVTPIDGRQYCHVVGGSNPGRREVQTGEFNDDFIEIRTGLKEGERVLLRQPAVETGEAGTAADPGAKPSSKPAAAPAAKP